MTGLVAWAARLKPITWDADLRCWRLSPWRWRPYWMEPTWPGYAFHGWAAVNP